MRRGVERDEKRAGRLAEEGPFISGIAERYASALFDLARDENVVDAVGRDLARFDEAVAGSADLERLVKNPIFGAEEQVGAMTALLPVLGIGGLTANFLKLVASKRRLFALHDMTRAFQRLNDEAKGVSRAEVTVAQPLSDAHRAALSSALRDSTGHAVEIAEKVDPAIIGGMIVKLGSRMVDSTVRTRLNSLKIAMNEVG